MNKILVLALVAVMCLYPAYSTVTRSVSGNTITYSSTVTSTHPKAYWSVYEGISGCAVSASSCSPSTNVGCSYESGVLKVVANTQEAGGALPATVTVTLQGVGTCSLSGQWVESYNTGTEAVVMSTPTSFSVSALTLSSTSYYCTGTTPSNAYLCSGDDTGLTANAAKSLVSSCGANKCEYVCNSGYSLSGGQCVAQAYTCTDMPLYSTVCPGDDVSLSANTVSTLVDICGAAKCEFVCSSGYYKLDNQCLAVPTCEAAGGVCCASGNTCTSPVVNTQGCSGTCCESGAFCATPTQTCAQLSGMVCGSTQTCQGGAFTTTTDTSLCCIDGTCQTSTTPAATCSLDCEFYERCNDTQTACEIAQWVYIAGGFIAFMFIWSMMK